MDIDWSVSSCSWLWEDDSEFNNEINGSHWTKEEDKAFENALAEYHEDVDVWDKIALAVPGKTMEDLKLHYEALSDDLVAIETGQIPLPDYPSNDSDHEKKNKKRSLKSLRRGVPWTEEEHRRFLSGLEKYGRGDWKSIARYSVQTKSNGQVASHAQKYFKRLSLINRKGTRRSIYDITSENPLHRPSTSTTPNYPGEKSTGNAGKQQFFDLTPFSSTFIRPFSSYPIGEPGRSAAQGFLDCSMFPPSFQEHDLEGMTTCNPPVPFMQDGGLAALVASGFPSSNKIQPLIDDIAMGVSGSLDLPPVAENQPLSLDNGMPSPGFFDFPPINQIEPAARESGGCLDLSDVPFTTDIGALLEDGGAPPVGSFGISSTSENQLPLMQDVGVPISSPLLDIEELMEDGGAPPVGSSDIPCASEIQLPSMQDVGVPIYSPLLDIDELMEDGGAPPIGSSDIPSAAEIQPPLVQDVGVPISSPLHDIASTTSEMMDIDPHVFVLPHFLD